MYIITGGGTGIGAALAAALAQRDCAVLIVGRRLACLQAVAETSSNIRYLSLDLTLEADRMILKEAVASYEHIAGLIHNAGMIDPIQPLSQLKDEDWRRILTLNLEVPYLLTKLFKPQLIGGRVLHIGSGAAHFPVASWGPYCVSKAGLAMLSQCWQVECPEIAFTCVMPGIVDTPMQDIIRASEQMADDKHDFFVKLKEQHKLLSCEQVASFLVQLLLDTPDEIYRQKEWDIYESHAKFPEVNDRGTI